MSLKKAVLFHYWNWARNCLTSKQLIHFLYKKWVHFCTACWEMCSKGYFRVDLCFFSFLLGKKFPGPSLLVKDAEVLILIPGILLPTDQCCKTLQKKKKWSHLNQLKSLPVNFSACTVQWKSALQQGLHHLEIFAKECNVPRISGLSFCSAFVHFHSEFAFWHPIP